MESNPLLGMAIVVGAIFAAATITMFPLGLAALGEWLGKKINALLRLRRWKAVRG